MVVLILSLKSPDIVLSVYVQTWAGEGYKVESLAYVRKLPKPCTDGGLSPK